MEYILNHTALYDGNFNLFHLVIILISVAAIAYCAIKLKSLSNRKKKLEKEIQTNKGVRSSR